jgi:hypothetical protein
MIAENNDAASTGPRAPTYLVAASGTRCLPAIAAAATAATAATTATATALAVVTATPTAIVTATAAATTVAAATTAAITPTAAVAAATTAVAAATTAAAEASTAATTALLTLLRLVHPKRTTVESATIHALDRLGGFLGGTHGHEGKAARAAGLTVRDQVDIADRSEFLERRTYALCVGVER